MFDRAVKTIEWESFLSETVEIESATADGVVLRPAEIHRTDGRNFFTANGEKYSV